MRRRSDVDAAVEEADRLEREPVGVGADVGRPTVEHHTERLEWLDPDGPRNVLARFAQKAHDLGRVVPRDLAEPRVELQPEVLAVDRLELERPVEGFRVGQPSLVRDRGEALAGARSPRLEFRPRRVEEAPEMMLRGREPAARTGEAR